MFGIVLGTLQLKKVNIDEIKENEVELKNIIEEVGSKEYVMHSKSMFWDGTKWIVFYWVIGMSLIGVPILVAHIGYKGYSLGYTISAIVKILGIQKGNQFLFQYLFLKNATIVFIMIFMINSSLKITRKYLEKKSNIKWEALKYSAISGMMMTLWLFVNLLEKMIFSTF